jgi:hypothetical protein
MLILCLYYACTEFTDTTYHYYLVRLWDMPQLLSMTCWQIPSDSKLGRFLAEAVHHVGLGTLASTLPWRGATLRQGAPRGHRAGWKRRHGTTSDPTSYATYAYLCNMFQYSSSFFKILSYLWGGGYGCCIILHHVTYIMLHHLDCWQYWFRSMSNHFDPCCVCCSGLGRVGRTEGNRAIRAKSRQGYQGNEVILVASTLSWVLAAWSHSQVGSNPGSSTWHTKAMPSCPSKSARTEGAGAWSSGWHS